LCAFEENGCKENFLKPSSGQDDDEELSSDDSAHPFMLKELWRYLKCLDKAKQRPADNHVAWDQGKVSFQTYVMKGGEFYSDVLKPILSMYIRL
jgi:hypothetical protein